MPRLLLILSILFFSFSADAQSLRYRDLVFKDVMITKNIPYRTSATNTIRNLLDVYRPLNDTFLNHPLVIWIHGGGFKQGKKTARGIPGWSKDFAKCGYVCAAMNYRLSSKKPLTRYKDLVEGCYDAIEDLDSAISFLKKHNREYGIDTNYIILGGNSAGAIVALQAVYSNAADLKMIFDSAGNRPAFQKYNDRNIACIINFWGAIFDTARLKHATVPIVSVQGTKDRVVPFESKNNLLFGAGLIHKQADALHIKNDLLPFKGYGHEIQKHFNPFFAGRKTRKRWKQAGDFAAAFLYNVLFIK